MNFTCSDEAATKAFAEKVASLVRGGETIGLRGGLGAGKTAFARFLSQALKSPDPVSSPTFTLMHEYEGKGGILIEHWDLYRLRELPVELFEPPGSGTIRIVEWFDKCGDFAYPVDLILDFEFRAEDEIGTQRVIHASGEKAQEL